MAQQHIRISPFPHHDAASAVGNERPPPNLDTRTLAAPKPPLPSAKNLLSAGYEDLNKAVLELLLKCEPHLTPADQSGSGKEVWRKFVHDVLCSSDGPLRHYDLGSNPVNRFKTVYLNQVVKTLFSQHEYNVFEDFASERVEILGHKIWKEKEAALAKKKNDTQKKKEAKAVKSAKLSTPEASLINRASLSIKAPSGSAKVGDMDGALGALSTNSKQSICCKILNTTF